MTVRKVETADAGGGRSPYQYQVACLDGIGGRLNVNITLPEGYWVDFDAEERELTFYTNRSAPIAFFTGVFFFIRSEVGT